MTLGPLTKSLKAEADAIDPRVRMPNPFVNLSGQPLLVSIEGTDFQQMLAQGLSAIGGLNLLIDNNQDVLIKPNLVVPDEPYPTISEASSVLTLLESVLQVTSGTVSVGDAGGVVPDRYYEFVGLDPAVPNAGGTLVDFTGTYEVRQPTWPPEIPDFLVYSAVYDAPVIINLCGLKRHNNTYFTCSLKNHVGAVDGPDAGPTRDYLHDPGPLTLGMLQNVAEIAGVVNSELAIVDARLIMALDGPIVGQPGYFGEIRELNKIVICGDPVATDAYCAQQLAQVDETFDPSTIEPTLTLAEDLGLGTADLEQVEIITLNAGPEQYPRPRNVMDGFELQQNYPNPFNATTTLTFTLPKATQVKLTIHDIAGRVLKTLLEDWKPAGQHRVTFNASGLASGLYVYQLRTPDYTSGGMMNLIK